MRVEQKYHTLIQQVMLQFRNSEEQEQSVILPIGKLSTFEFDAATSDILQAKELSKKAVYEYFELF